MKCIIIEGDQWPVPNFFLKTVVYEIALERTRETVLIEKIKKRKKYQEFCDSGR